VRGDGILIIINSMNTCIPLRACSGRVRRLVGLLRTMIKHTDTHVITEDCDAFGLPAA